MVLRAAFSPGVRAQLKKRRVTSSLDVKFMRCVASLSNLAIVTFVRGESFGEMMGVG